MAEPTTPAAAMDAAYATAREVWPRQLPGSDPVVRPSLRALTQAIVEAAAPHIAAQALCDAADHLVAAIPDRAAAMQAAQELLRLVAIAERTTQLADSVAAAAGTRHPSDTAPDAPQGHTGPFPGPSRRLRHCVEQWPDAETGGYDPKCCRFPKSCSATVYDPESVTDEDLEPLGQPPGAPTAKWDPFAGPPLRFHGPCGCPIETYVSHRAHCDTDDPKESNR